MSDNQIDEIKSQRAVLTHEEEAGQGPATIALRKYLADRKKGRSYAQPSSDRMQTTTKQKMQLRSLETEQVELDENIKWSSMSDRDLLSWLKRNDRAFVKDKPGVDPTLVSQIRDAKKEARMRGLHEDINNDGKVDSSDEYLYKRRQAIKRNMEKGKQVQEQEQVNEVVHGKTYTKKQLLGKIKMGEWEATHDIKPGRSVEMRHHSGRRVTVQVDEEVLDVSYCSLGEQYTVATEKHKGGYRPKLINKEGKTSYLSQHVYKKADKAKEHAKVYADAVSSVGGDHAAKQAANFVRQNAAHLHEDAEHRAMSRGLAAASRRAHASNERGAKQAKKWMKKTGRSAEEAVKEFDLPRSYVQKLSEEVEQIDEISRDLARRYISKAADDRAWGTPTKERENRHKGIRLAARKAGLQTAIGGKARVPATEEAEQIDESAKVADHLIKRYGQNVRKNHVRSAADDFGVGYVALSLAVRKKLGVNRLEEDREVEQIDELSKKTLASYAHKAQPDADEQDRLGISYSDKASRTNRPDRAASLSKKASKSFIKAANRHAGVTKAINKLAKEEVDQIDELSREMKTRYKKAAQRSLDQAQDFKSELDQYQPKGSQARKDGDRVTKSVDRIIKNRTRGMKRANEEADLFESHFKVGDDVICTINGSAEPGQVVDVDAKEKGKYYTVELDSSGKHIKCSPDQMISSSEVFDESAKADAVRQFRMDMAKQMSAQRRGPTKTISDPDHHIINQLRKAKDVRGRMPIKFEDGKTHTLSFGEVSTALNRHGSIKRAEDREKFQDEIAKSYDHFKKHVK